ncbi:hypothetical protein OEZ85_004750 [Tetradesmus obliquus]|uniref:Tyrosine-protein kinase ephrin type A/B receptor-like domain-containing protein n=1 Tax=Tetradesmus obliquus TaxID=3088 RepID=A0ABY8UMG9_TETOB|nr:hypothetical protein OEZ85_004750 [Tetradesmus obliquus]
MTVMPVPCRKEAWVCLRCLAGYRPVRGMDGKSIVQCVCPPGTYQVLSGTSRSCEKCPKGSFCTGGSIRQGSAAAAAPILDAGYMLEGAALNDPLATLPQDADIVEAVTCPIGYYSTGGSMVSCKQ